MPIVGVGWELHVVRAGIQQSGHHKRTYGSYRSYENGAPTNLVGNTCESVGPGDNNTRNNSKRIEEGRYPLWTHFKKYRTIGYSNNTTVPGRRPMPAVGLSGCGNRSDILIHPAHPPSLYLSSIGCLNPTLPLDEDDLMDFWDSRSRVIAIIDSLRTFAPEAFLSTTPCRIPDAWIVIDGEPMNPVHRRRGRPRRIRSMGVNS
ncbi:hypothetical protein JOE50_008049 [Bradyrhizobium japonicum]|nr:hypothetical protein [Bradyrhizobium japonicum]